MCIIAVSRKGIRQPSLKQLRTMYDNNPDGAGYMYARGGKVHIHKGFMTWEDFERQIKAEAFTENDPVVYHFRISTQAGVKPTMTHPFPLTGELEKCEALDLTCPIGLAHNGIILMTSFHKEVRYSDTAYFIAWYMTKLLRNREDIKDPCVNDMIDTLTNSTWAIMDGKTGDIETVGKFVNNKGLLFSNNTYKKAVSVVKSDYTYTNYPYSYDWDEYDWQTREYGNATTGKTSDSKHTTKSGTKVPWTV